MMGTTAMNHTDRYNVWLEGYLWMKLLAVAIQLSSIKDYNR